jgi:peptide chain release factor 2
LSELAKKKNLLEDYSTLESQKKDIETFFELIKEDDLYRQDSSLNDEYKAVFEIFKSKIDVLEITALLSGDYDRYDAIFSINSGAGGTDAQDWAQMLLRMYVRWFEKKGYSFEILDEMMGDEAGIKSVTIHVKGEFVFGLLKQEIGVHRLVRLSPFNANNKRQTSFASVDVIPDIKDNLGELTIDPKELKIDTFRASGAGGQHVNKTDSAVRITHLPTGLVATSQASRSQLSNKETAMGILQSRLIMLMKEKHISKIQDLRGDVISNSWGNQIRSYVLHPYKLVKDLRTNLETSNVMDVLDGDIDDFIHSKLRFKEDV